MVVIRFQRRGTKKTPHHRIVVQDRQEAQSSRVLEVLGIYDPGCTPPKFQLDQARLSHWVSTGAKVSEALQRVIKKNQRAPKAAKAKAAKAA